MGKRTRTGISILLALTILVLALAGCGNTAQQTQTTAQTPAPTDTEVVATVEPEDTSTQDDPDGTHTVVDPYGQSWEIANTVNSIVVPFPAAAQMILGLGAADLLTGGYLTESTLNHTIFQETMDRIVVIRPTNDLPVEEVMNCAPDFAVLYSEAQVDCLADTGIPCLLYSVNDIAGMKENMNVLAEAIGTDKAKENAVAYSDFYDRLLAEVTSMTSAIPEDEKPVVFFNMGTDELNTYPGNTIASDWVEYSGGVYAATLLGLINEEGPANGLNGVTVTAEELINVNPDIIICTSQEGIDAIYANPAFAGITAVKEGNIYLNPEGACTWVRAHFEAPLQLTWAPKIISPDYTQDLDSRAYVQEFYEQFYDYTLSDEEYEGIVNPVSIAVSPTK